MAPSHLPNAPTPLNAHHVYRLTSLLSLSPGDQEMSSSSEEGSEDEDDEDGNPLRRKKKKHHVQEEGKEWYG